MLRKDPEGHGPNIDLDTSSNPAFDLRAFKESVIKIKVANKVFKQSEISNILVSKGMFTSFYHRATGRIVVTANPKFDYPHEKITAEKLAGENYDVIFVPKGYFKRHEKKFDVFLCRDHIFLEADLKYITSSNPDTIAKKIKGGSEQASRLILDLHNNIKRKALIDGLRSGCERNGLLTEILLFYNTRFYCLPKTRILSRKIFEVIK